MNKHFTPTCDASLDGIGYILSHIGEENRELVIAYGGRAPHKVEKNYTITELECLIFLISLEKNIMRYKHIGFNLNVMRQSACLVINPITVDSYAALFNCTPVDRASDSMMAPT